MLLFQFCDVDCCVLVVFSVVDVLCEEKVYGQESLSTWAVEPSKGLLLN